MPWERVMFDPQRMHRRSIRLPGYDYSSEGMYFVTICTAGRVCLFGDVVNGVMVPNMLGHVAQAEWRRSAEIRPEIEIDAFVVMPNHLHGIVGIGPVGAHAVRPYVSTACQSSIWLRQSRVCHGLGGGANEMGRPAPISAAPVLSTPSAARR